MDFIVAYDIADPRRLQRVCRRLEKHAMRCQKSVFLFTGDPQRVRQVLDELAPLMNLREDVVQAWRVARDPAHLGLIRGVAVPRRPCAVVSTGKHAIVASEVQS